MLLESVTVYRLHGSCSSGKAEGLLAWLGERRHLLGLVRAGQGVGRGSQAFRGSYSRTLPATMAKRWSLATWAQCGVT